VADLGSGGIAVRGGGDEKTGSGGVLASHSGSGDDEGGKGTRWIATLAEADTASEVVQDGARKAACVGATYGAGSAACVVARRAPVTVAAGTACA
jgi:hypothetical protein